MDNKKIINRLKEIKEILEGLKKQHYSKGESEFETNRDLIIRIIDRTYSEKDAKNLKDRLKHNTWVVSGNETEEYWQKFYTDKIDLSLKVISIILKEYELFGFDNFKPIKEKIETEFGFGLGKLFSWKKKKIK